MLRNFFCKDNIPIGVGIAVLFCGAFYLHYSTVMNYHYKLFQYTEETAKLKVFAAQKSIFRQNFLGNAAVFLVQVIGATLALNIGLLFVGYKFQFRKLAVVVVKSSVILLLIYYLIWLVLLLQHEVYTFDTLYHIETRFTLASFVGGEQPLWLRNLLESFSLTQAAFVPFLALGIRYLIDVTYKKAIPLVLKIYGIAFSLWIIFALIMDLNFFY